MTRVEAAKARPGWLIAVIEADAVVLQYLHTGAIGLTFHTPVMTGAAA
jgi:hypothetical protein